MSEEVIDLCDSPSPAKASAARKIGGNGTSGAAGADGGGKRAKLEQPFAAASNNEENFGYDSDVEFIDPAKTKGSQYGSRGSSNSNVLMNSPLLNSPPPAAAAARAQSRTGLAKDDRMYDSSDDDDDDNANMQNGAGKKKKSGNAGKKKDDAEDSDDELEIVGTKGVSALIDFPHSRENCLTHRFQTARSGSSTQKNLEHCVNCYCYVCDVPAKDCKKWTDHCQATHGDRRWREERERYKRLGIEAASAAAQPPQQQQQRSAVAAAASSTTTLVRSSNANRSTNRHGNRPDLPQYSIQALLEKLTVVHPVEATPPTPTFRTSLRHYQKQSLAFMLDAERSNSHPSPLNASMSDGTAIRGGWLCDQVGMGKSAVTLALVASNPMTTPPTAQTIQEQMDRYQKWKRQDDDWYDNAPRDPYFDSLVSKSYEESHPPPPKPANIVTLKATVILTSVSLLGQWEDECAKHLDGSLKVMVCHSSRPKKKSLQFFNTAAKTIADVDIIISTATKPWDSDYTSAFSFHRVVMDEAHLLGKGNSANVGAAMKIKSKRRWCVTATPCTSSTSELDNQIRFLASTWNPGPGCFVGSISSKRGFYDALDRLKAMLVRHTKSQRIGGDEALALPPSTTTTTLISMSDTERRSCRDSIQNHLLRKYQQTGQSTTAVSRALGLVGGWGSDSKIRALRKKLREMRRTDPGLRAVIFTHYTKTHKSIVSQCREEGYSVFEFTGSTGATQRDRQIREFQQERSSSRPSVFVITMRAGSVGITLTAASHCFLMEPCLDPATEVQAAGRVHRLGQTKPVHVTKFVFSRSPEENVLALHREIAAARIKIVDNQVPTAAVSLLMRGL